MDRDPKHAGNQASLSAAKSKLPTSNCLRELLFIISVSLLVVPRLLAWPQRLGDLDSDGKATVGDLVQLAQHVNSVRPLPPDLLPFADVNQNGTVDQADVDFLVDAILGMRQLPMLADSDRDGLPDVIEEILNLGKSTVDTDGDGVNDGDEDNDNDALTNLQEFHAGTDPAFPDTDGDGWPDEAELTAVSDPLNPFDLPRLLTLGRPELLLSLPVLPPSTGDFAPGVTMASPQVTSILPQINVLLDLESSSITAVPPVSLILPGFPGTSAEQTGLTLGYPPASLILPAFPETGAEQTGLTLGYPPVELEITGTALEPPQLLLHKQEP